MKKLRTLIITLSLLSFFQALGQDMTTLYGQIRDVDGDLYFPATVSIILFDSVLKKVTVDYDGKFKIDSLPQNEMLNIEAKGHNVWTNKHYFLRKFNSTSKIITNVTDTISIQLKVDTLDTEILDSIGYLNLSGRFYCLGDNCLDSLGRESGIMTSYVSGMGYAYTSYKVVVNDQVICSINDEKEGNIFYFNDTKERLLINHDLNYKEIKGFLSENFENGQLKSHTEFYYKGKKINNAP